MRTIGVGVIGCGVIGGGVIEHLLKKGRSMHLRNGVNIVLKYACDKDIKKRKELSIPQHVFTKDYHDLLSDPAVDIIVELIGGTKLAREIIKKALQQHKHVVTANKALLAEYGKELFPLARKQSVFINYEASVCGGIPIIKSISEGLSANKIFSILAIVNGTSNYVLTKMKEEGCPFKLALKDAQRLGFAEANPTLDIEGDDAAHKLALLTMLSFGYLPKQSEIFKEGIGRIQSCDVAYASEMNCVIKPLAIAKIVKGELELRVHPTLIPKEHVLSNINGEYNAAFINSDLLGDSLFYGKGAGRYPTAGAVISDILDISRKIMHRGSGAIPPEAHVLGKVFFAPGLKVKNIDKIISAYYIRITAADKPGVLTKVSGILADHKISIANVSQKKENTLGFVPVVMITHEATESSIKASIKKIDKLPVIKGKSVVIRMESSDEA